MKIPQKGPGIDPIIEKLSKENPGKLLKIFTEQGPVDAKNRYLHWEEIRVRAAPENYTNEEWWVAIKLARKKIQRKLPFYDKRKYSFNFVLTDQILRTLHWLDQQMAGNLSATPADVNCNSVLSNQDLKRKYVIKSLIEEAISSSQLEGAATTRDVAKEMLRQKRKPKDISEQMIYNNYLAMEFIKSLKDEPLTKEIIFEIHKIITQDTLKAPHRAGQFRAKNDPTVVEDMHGEVLHDPPEANELPDRLDALISFANAQDTPIFIHPIIKAIIIHFMIGYDHPFVDGNGRTARALFYWAMIHQGYWRTEFISISELIKRAPVKYGRAFLYTETDDNDTTYFIIHQLEIIKKASEELINYMMKKHDENKKFEILFPVLQQSLNIRQVDLIKHIIRNPRSTYTIKGYKDYFNIVYETARKDLLELGRKHKLLDITRQGTEFKFTAPTDIKSRIKAILKKNA